MTYLHNLLDVPQHQMNMYKCLSAIMHLGNVDFSENDDEQSAVRNKPQLQVVAVSAAATVPAQCVLYLSQEWLLLPFCVHLVTTKSAVASLFWGKSFDTGHLIVHTTLW